MQKGLLYPINNLGPLAQAEWFDYTADPEETEQAEYALPFAGDALALLYRPEMVETPPAMWADVQQLQFPLLFAAAEPQAYFTLTQYRASGGPVEDSDGRPFLNQEDLTAVYIFYQRSSDGEQMPFWLTQYEDDDQVWEDYLDGRSPLAATWVSHYLRSQPQDTAVEQLPTESGRRVFPGDWLGVGADEPGQQPPGGQHGAGAVPVGCRVFRALDDGSRLPADAAGGAGNLD